MDDINPFLSELKTSLLELKLHVVAGDILNAFYSSLILKKMSGVEITLEIETEAMVEAFSKYKVFCDKVSEGQQLLKQPGKPWRPV